MITGENSKGYGQELYIFGKKKGSGETIWDIKKNLGYLTPSMTDFFSGYHTVEQMVVSGLHDSVGLYVRPTETQLQLAQKWLRSVGIWDRKNVLFLDLDMGEQRLIMLVRAMIKHPWLLILDEPTAGLDGESAALFVELVNRISKESRTALLYVSHRKETGLRPQYVYELHMTDQGSMGRAI
jgi:molybdate transport system ATP-binding protein